MIFQPTSNQDKLSDEEQEESKREDIKHSTYSDRPHGGSALHLLQ